MKLGYARISTLSQTLDHQIDALKQLNCDRIFTDEVSGSKKERPGLSHMKEVMRKGDTIIVWRLDRLGRSMKDLIELIEFFKDKEVLFLSIKEGIDTTTINGQLMLHLFASFADFERNIIRERTLSGLQAARARGRIGGRRFKFSNDKRELVRDLYNGKNHSLAEISEMMGISVPTIYNYMRTDKSNS